MSFPKCRPGGVSHRPGGAHAIVSGPAVCSMTRLFWALHVFSLRPVMYRRSGKYSMPQHHRRSRQELTLIQYHVHSIICAQWISYPQVMPKTDIDHGQRWLSYDWAQKPTANDMDFIWSTVTKRIFTYSLIHLTFSVVSAEWSKWS